MADLKTCPFCGSKAVLRAGGEWYGVGCSALRCPAALFALVFKSQQEAADAWNKRHGATPDAKPYAYEYGRSNGDGTYSIVIDRGSHVQVGPRAWDYGPPRDPHPDHPVKPLYEHADRH